MKDKSFEEIDVLKLLIYSFSFITICTGLILFLLLPILKEYKEIVAKENIQNSSLVSTNKELKASEDKLSLLRKENNISLEQFKRQFDVQNFVNFTKNYFQNVKIKSLDTNQSIPYLKEHLLIQANIKNPRILYNFIDHLKQYKNLIQIDYPLTLKADDKDIAVSFPVKIYFANP